MRPVIAGFWGGDTAPKGDLEIERQIRVNVLGEFEMSICGHSAKPSACKPRQVLALLALHPERIVPINTIVEELWGEAPPTSVRTTLQTYILQLRRLIAAAMPAEFTGRVKNILATRFDGYMLAIPPENVDTYHYSLSVEAGVAAMCDGQYAVASELFNSALARWRGPALVDVRHGTSLSIEATRLEEARLYAAEARIQAELMLGRHTCVLGDLQVLTSRYPLHERLRAMQMVALHHSGRKWQALAAYKSLRNSLSSDSASSPRRTCRTSTRRSFAPTNERISISS